MLHSLHSRVRVLVTVALLLAPLALVTATPAGAVDDLEPPSQPADPRWTDENGVLVESTSAGDTTIYAAWDAATDAGTGVAAYHLQLSETPEFAIVLADRTTTTPDPWATFTESDGVAYGHSYYFRVAARDGAGNESTWSGPSNRVGVREDPTGPAIAHAPVPTAYYGRAIPIEMTATCSGKGACDASLYYRATAAQDILGGPEPAWTRVPMDRGETTFLNGQQAVEWSAEIPGATVTTTGVDYRIEAEDALAITYFPGTPFVGTASTPGIDPVASYHHVHTVSPPLLTHVPPPYAHADADLVLTLDATCSTPSCTATMYYRTTTGPITSSETVVAENGDLLALPAWPHVTMDAVATTALGDAGVRTTYQATIPASYVDTRGVDYFFHVADGHVRAWSPGSTYQGYYAPRDGMRTGYWHAHVTEPPRIVHVHRPTATYREAITIEGRSPCAATRDCEATLYYRTTKQAVTEGPQQTVAVEVGETSAEAGGESAGTGQSYALGLPGGVDGFESVPMTVERTGVSADGVDVILVRGTIPSTATDTRGVDYFFSITDGSTTAYWPGTSHVDGYAHTDGTRVAYHHVRVLDPPHFVHRPPLVADPDEDLVVQTELTCATEACTANLTYTADPDAGPDAYESVPMTRTAVLATTDASRVEQWQATIPAADVTTRGVAYYMTAFDGYTRAAAPGTSYWGAYLPIDGTTVNGAEATVDGESGPHVAADGEAVVMYPVRVLEPPHPVSVPPVVTEYGSPVTIGATSNCATAQCDAVIEWRTTDHRWHRDAMPGIETALPDHGSVWSYSFTVPASAVTVEGLDYRVIVDDGYVVQSTPTAHVGVPNARQDERYGAVADTWVGTASPSHGTEATAVVSPGTDALLRFDVGDVPRAHHVVAATLDVTVSGDAAVDVAIAPVTSAWTESVTGASRPTVDSGRSTALVPGRMRLDVTDLVQSWVANPSTNYGVALHSRSLLAHVTSIATRENADAAARPVLRVTHVATDTERPSVTLTAPAAGSVVAGTISLQATAADDVAVSRVDFVVDDDVVASATTPSTGTTYTASLDTTLLPEGLRDVWARAVDSSGNVGASGHVTVRVRNDVTPPTVSITNPVAAEVLTGDAQVRATASDDRSVARVEFLVDGTAFALDATAPYTAYFDTSALADGAHTLTARAVDPSDNVGESAAVSVTLANQVGAPLYPAIRPAAIIAGTASTVDASVRVRGNATGSVEVLDGAGTVVGTLADNGVDPDMVANDGVFSAALTLTSATDVQLRARATIDGTLTVSPSVLVEALPAGAPRGLAVASTASPVVDTSSGDRFVNNQLLVSMEPGVSYADGAAAIAAGGGTVVGRLAGTGTWQVQIPTATTTADLQAAIDDIAREAGVFSAEPNGIDDVAEVDPNDDEFWRQYGPRRMRADEAWVVDRGGGVFFANNQRLMLTAAVLDTGLDFDHPDLAEPRFHKGRDFYNDDANPADDDGHGTWVAGIISADTNNDEGVAGMSWHTDILVEKVCGADDDGCSNSAEIDALDHAVSKNVAVVNMSIGGAKGRSENFVKALDRANRANVLVVISAGNDHTDSQRFPGGYGESEQFSSWFGINERTYHTSVLTVGATDRSDDRADFSNYGDWVEVAAPGVDIYSTALQRTSSDDAYSEASGTSFSAPLVAGAAMLVFNEHINWTEDMVRHRLIDTADPLPAGEELGAGIVDAYEAVVNGGFETGDLSEWTSTGSARAVRSLGSIRPDDGSDYMAMISTGDGAVGGTTSTLTLDTYVLTESGPVTVRLDYDFVSDEYPEFVGSRYNDTFEAYLLLDDGRRVDLASETVNAASFTAVSGVDLPGGDGSAGHTGWTTASATFDMAGSTKMTLVVRDVGDTIYDSVVLIDHLRLE